MSGITIPVLPVLVSLLHSWTICQLLADKFCPSFLLGTLLSFLVSGVCAFPFGPSLVLFGPLFVRVLWWRRPGGLWSVPAPVRVPINKTLAELVHRAHGPPQPTHRTEAVSGHSRVDRLQSLSRGRAPRSPTWTRRRRTWQPLRTTTPTTSDWRQAATATID